MSPKLKHQLDQLQASLGLAPTTTSTVMPMMTCVLVARLGPWKIHGNLKGPRLTQAATGGNPSKK